MICRIVHKKVQINGGRSNFHIPQLLTVVKAYEQKRIVRVTGKRLPIILENLNLIVILSFSRLFKRPSLLSYKYLSPRQGQNFRGLGKNDFSWKKRGKRCFFSENRELHKPRLPKLIFKGKLHFNSQVCKGEKHQRLKLTPISN